MKKMLLVFMISLFSVSIAQAVVYVGAMDNRAGFPFVPGFTAQTRAWVTGDAAGGGLRLEWQVDDESTPGFWTYRYRLLRGVERNKGFAYFDIETAPDFAAANIMTRQVLSATDRFGGPIPSGLGAITISDPVNFNAVHNYSNPAVSETSAATALNKSELSHYSGDPGRVAVGVPGTPASATPSVGPVPHPFYGIRVTFPGSFLDLAYEACEWEFRVVADRAPMWGKVFGWADQTILTPFWYTNFYNDTIDIPDRLALAPVNSLTGAGPYRGWVLVPGALPGVASTLPADTAVGVPVTEPVSGLFSGMMDPATLNSGTFTLTNSDGPVSGTVGYDSASKTATFHPALPLASGTVYTATIAAGVRDLAGNLLGTEKTWSFTTSSQDLTPPAVTAMHPGDGNTYLPITATFTATFSEAIDPATLTPANFSVTGVSGTVGYDPSTRSATFTPGAPLSNNTSYTATIGTGVRDLAGNPLSVPVSWSAATIPAETVLPFVVTTFPAARAVNVATTTSISAAFNEAIDPASINSSTFSVAGVTGTTGYDVATLTATFIPAAPLAFNTSYALTVTTGVMDLAGNPVGLTKNFSFRTLSQLAATFTASGTTTGPGATPLAGIPVKVNPTSQSGTAQQIVLTNGAGQFSAASLLNGTYIFTPASAGRIFSPRSISAAVTNGNVTALNFTGNPLIISPGSSSPQPAGTPVVFTASVQGGIETYEYQFWFWNGTAWTLVQDYGPANSWVMPGTTPVGAYTIQTNVRAAGSSAEKEAVAQVTNYRIAAPQATGVDLTAAPANSQITGNPTTFSAVGHGSTGYEYQFWLWNGAGWSRVQDYGSTASWVMPGTTPVGEYTVQVNVRGAGSAAEKDVQARVSSFRITSPAATGVTLTANPSGFQTFGSTTAFTAAGQGSSAYEYEFWLWNGVAWSRVQSYGSADSWIMPNTTPAGLYTVQVNVRGAGFAAESNASARVVNFRVVPPAATGVLLEATPAVTQLFGNTVSFKATGQGSTAYEYEFWLWNGASWSLVQTYSPTDTWIMPDTTPAGFYTIQVNVRGASSGVEKNTQARITNYQITP